MLMAQMNRRGFLKAAGLGALLGTSGCGTMAIARVGEKVSGGLDKIAQDQSQEYQAYMAIDPSKLTEQQAQYLDAYRILNKDPGYREVFLHLTDKYDFIDPETTRGKVYLIQMTEEIADDLAAWSSVSPSP